MSQAPSRSTDRSTWSAVRDAILTRSTTRTPTDGPCRRTRWDRPVSGLRARSSSDRKKTSIPKISPTITRWCRQQRTTYARRLFLRLLFLIREYFYTDAQNPQNASCSITKMYTFLIVVQFYRPMCSARWLNVNFFFINKINVLWILSNVCSDRSRGSEEVEIAFPTSFKFHDDF